MTAARDEDQRTPWYAGADLDGLKVDRFNASLHLSPGRAVTGVGVDIIDNFGTSVGALLRRDGFQPTMTTGVYFAF